MLPFILAAVGGYLIWDSNRTSYADGGEIDLKKFRDKYDKNEDKNFHRENLILLAKTFGDENDVKEAKKIKSKADSIGYMPSDLNDVSYALHKKLWSRYLKVKELKGEKLNDGGELKYIGSVAVVETPEDFKKWADTRKNKMELINEYEGFKVGDTVTYTNEAGIEFPNMKIIGIEKDTSFYGRNIYLNSDAYWYPHSTKELTKEK